MARQESFGIHDAAYRVGRGELLQWVNNLLGVDYTKVEQCANGASWCKILNETFQVWGTSSLSRISDRSLGSIVPRCTETACQLCSAFVQGCLLEQRQTFLTLRLALTLHAGDQEDVIPPKKILLDAKLEHDVVKNYKLLQAAFMKKNINKVLAPVHVLPIA